MVDHIPDRGDVVRIEPNPQAGHEQAGKVWWLENENLHIDRCHNMSTKQAHIGTRIDREAKEACEKVFRHLGLTTAEAIRIFLSQVRIHGSLPFRSEINPQSEGNDDLLLPNEMRQAAIDTIYDD